jgi:hypothetical protein
MRRRPSHPPPSVAWAAILSLVLLGACGAEGRGALAVGEDEVAAAAATTTTTTAAPTADSASSAPDTTTPATTTPAADAAAAPVDEPEVLVVGDSLIWLQEDALAADLAAADVDLHLAGGSGTGLLTGQTAWLDAIEAAVAEDDPDVVVIEACCNYGATEEAPEHGYTLMDGSVVVPDSEVMYELWAAAAEEAVRVASAGGATVLWVLVPPVASDDVLHDRIERFNLIARNLQEEFPSLVLVDWERALTDATGALIDPIEADDGTMVPLRIDNIHLSEPANVIVRAVTVEAVVDALAA